jgi:predicted DNA-binding protein YlxM (UPF0122 family)
MTRSQGRGSGGLHVDKVIVDIAKALKESEQTMGICLQQALDVLLNHEERLQKLERPDIRCDLVDVKRFIEDIEDPAKKGAAKAEFATLCRILGFEDLEE